MNNLDGYVCTVVSGAPLWSDDASLEMLGKRLKFYPHVSCYINNSSTDDPRSSLWTSQIEFSYRLLKKDDVKIFPD
ncbi:hypothetical protein DPEC_G00075860 [Dallia pectoralis]|uniref:Uncharacterized protein n=1 Tax=Dallia pectoralis TaxID=75939 RepID=A0ACC2H421_DALPE|nr:hypothetical protein DPEC_G00075860 [Dallia pectoralis]